jgi:putative transposase
MLFSGSLNATGFEGWLKIHLLPALTNKSLLIMDHAPIHRKNEIKQLAESAGHEVLFLPTYSPDFNDIEHDFSDVKKRRSYAFPRTTIDQIICAYCSN